MSRPPMTALAAGLALVGLLQAAPVAQAATAPAPAPAAASASLPVASGLAQTVRERLQRPASLRGDFVQTKRVQGFAKPLVSRGDFQLARGQGVLWRTAAPFASSLRITRDEIRASQGGQGTMQLDAAQEPAVRTISRLMLALLEGDLSGVDGLFELSGNVRASGWTLTLTPRPGPLQQVLRQIVLEGDAFVRRVQLLEAGGDESLIQLNNLRPGAAPDPGVFP